MEKFNEQFNKVINFIKKYSNDPEAREILESINSFRPGTPGNRDFNETTSLDFQRVGKIGGWSYELNSGRLQWTSEHYHIFEIPEPQDSGNLYLLYRQRIHPDDLPNLDRVLERAIKFGEDFVYEHRVHLDDGQRIKYVRGIGKVEMGPDKRPFRVVGTCQDITDIKELELRNRFVLETLGLGIWKFNPSTQALWWDESLYNLYEIRKSDFTGDYQAWENSLSPNAKADAVEQLRLALTGEKDFNTTFEIRTPAGKVKYIGGRGVVTRDSKGAPIMMYGINWDRTKEVELERAVEEEKVKAIQNSKLAALGELSAGVAHEINNPLAIIVASMTNLKKFRTDEEKFDKKLETLKTSVDRIEKIVKGLGKFSRQSERKKRYLSSLKGIVEEALTIVEPTAVKNGVRIDLNFSSKCNVSVDPVEIGQVVMNLLNNAIYVAKKFEDRWVRIDVFSENGWGFLRVTDPGQGIPEEVSAKIFNPFFTTKPIGEGTGLGLSISKGIIDEHQGVLSVVSSSKNTALEFKLPLAPESPMV